MLVLEEDDLIFVESIDDDFGVSFYSMLGLPVCDLQEKNTNH